MIMFHVNLQGCIQHIPLPASTFESMSFRIPVFFSEKWTRCLSRCNIPQYIPNLEVAKRKKWLILEMEMAGPKPPILDFLVVEVASYIFSTTEN